MKAMTVALAVAAFAPAAEVERTSGGDCQVRLVDLRVKPPTATGHAPSRRCS